MDLSSDFRKEVGCSDPCICLKVIKPFAEFFKWAVLAVSFINYGEVAYFGIEVDEQTPIDCCG